MTDCVPFTGVLDPDGYGRKFRDGKRHGAHRVAYADSRGLPLSALKGWVVRHSCDNPCCVNPGHLLLGSVADNNRDKAERGRGVTHQRKQRTLTDEAVRLARAIQLRGWANSPIAKTIGVPCATVGAIFSGRTYKEIS